jgi:hypothetical protein
MKASFILRLLFWPVGLAMLAGTALVELMDEKTDWEYWRDHNAFVLRIMWLRR